MEGSAQPKAPKNAARACDSCRSKHIRCDGSLPCYQCKFREVECTYSNTRKRKSSSEGSSASPKSKPKKKAKRSSSTTSTTPPNDVMDHQSNSLSKINRHEMQAIIDSFVSSRHSYWFRDFELYDFDTDRGMQYWSLAGDKQELFEKDLNVLVGAYLHYVVIAQGCRDMGDFELSKIVSSLAYDILHLIVQKKDITTLDTAYISVFLDMTTLFVFYYMSSVDEHAKAKSVSSISYQLLSMYFKPLTFKPPTMFRVLVCMLICCEYPSEKLFWLLRIKNLTRSISVHAAVCAAFVCQFPYRLSDDNTSPDDASKLEYSNEFNHYVEIVEQLNKRLITDSSGVNNVPSSDIYVRNCAILNLSQAILYFNLDKIEDTKFFLSKGFENALKVLKVQPDSGIFNCSIISGLIICHRLGWTDLAAVGAKMCKANRNFPLLSDTMSQIGKYKLNDEDLKVNTVEQVMMKIIMSYNTQPSSLIHESVHLPRLKDSHHSDDTKLPLILPRVIIHSDSESSSKIPSYNSGSSISSSPIPSASAFTHREGKSYSSSPPTTSTTQAKMKINDKNIINDEDKVATDYLEFPIGGFDIPSIIHPHPHPPNNQPMFSYPNNGKLEPTMEFSPGQSVLANAVSQFVPAFKGTYRTPSEI
eukprot:TRINITY_DN1717_c0_g3_i1.p1 TRINITY_DN1717_c0_g3~~TRINITY_DN1717_c0_g3_i1.p1  ORF type:complete len:643 (-),score=75.55 TRINITY_DN1717_c0_g3_i1:492-2420(-)